VFTRAGAPPAAGSLADSLVDRVSRIHSDRRRDHAGFTTSLSLRDIELSAAEAVTAFAGARVEKDAAGRAVVVFGSGGGAVVDVLTDSRGQNRVRLGPLGSGTSDAALLRFRGCLLAALRTRDPQTRYR
jgi:hypothetical protein